MKRNIWIDVRESEDQPPQDLGSKGEPWGTLPIPTDCEQEELTYATRD